MRVLHEHDDGDYNYRKEDAGQHVINRVLLGLKEAKEFVLLPFIVLCGLITRVFVGSIFIRIIPVGVLFILVGVLVVTVRVFLVKLVVTIRAFLVKLLVAAVRVFLVRILLRIIFYFRIIFVGSIIFLVLKFFRILCFSIK